MKKYLQEIVNERQINNMVFDEARFILFCKNLKQLAVQRMRTIVEEITEPNWNLDVVNEYWDENNCVRWFIVMKAFEALTRLGHFLGENFAS